MIGSVILLLGAAVSTPAPALPFREQIERTKGGTVLLKDMADISSLPAGLREEAADLVIARLPEGQSRTTFTHAALRSRARSLLPALGPWLKEPSAGFLTITVRPSGMPQMTAACGAGGVTPGAKVAIIVAGAGFGIERQTTALQAALPGDRFFARTHDGSILSVCCAS